MKRIEVWETKRCKRIIRPFLSKLHTLTDLVIKNPDLLYGGVNSSFNQKPATANDRLLILKSYNPELFKIYQEIFVIFKQIITSIGINTHNSTTKLSKICCYDIGKAMVLSSRTSYYKLNQSVLFDPHTLDPSIKVYHDNLAQDIDGWLELEPTSIFHKHRLDLLTGYILHLIIFNSSTILYLLVPVLVHWLYETSVVQSSSESSAHLRYLSTYLFKQFWTFNNDTYYENIDLKTIHQLTGLPYPSNALFWDLEKHNYWHNLISSLGIQSTYNHNNYENLLLDILVYRFDYDNFNYKLLYINPHHSQTNRILITVLTHLINKKPYDETTLKSLNKLVTNWISFKCTRPMLYNSLLAGNEHLFQGVIKFDSFLRKKLHLPQTNVLALLVGFFLDKDFEYSIQDDPEMMNNFLDYQQYDFLEALPLDESHNEVNDFLYWLVDNGFGVCALRFFVLVYGRYDRYDGEVQDIYDLIHSSEAETRLKKKKRRIS